MSTKGVRCFVYRSALSTQFHEPHELVINFLKENPWEQANLIIPWARVGYEMVNSQRRVGYKPI